MNAVCPFAKSPKSLDRSQPLFYFLSQEKVIPQEKDSHSQAGSTTKSLRCVRVLTFTAPESLRQIFLLVRYGRAKILATALFHLDTSWPAALIMKSLFYIF